MSYVPMAYPFEFRKRVVDAYLRGEGSLAELAEDYGVSIPTLHDWVIRLRQTGDLTARTSSGRPPKLDATARHVLRDLVAEDNDATLPMLARSLSRKVGVTVSPRTLGRALQELDVTRKKSPSSRRNVEAWLLSSREVNSVAASRASTRRA